MNPHAANATLSSPQPMVCVAIAMAAGAAADYYLAPSLGAWLLAGTVLWCGWLAARRLGGDRAGAWLILASVAAAAGGWHHWQWRLFSAEELGLLATEAPAPVCVEAVVSQSPRWSPAPPENPLTFYTQGDKTLFVVNAVRIRDGDRWRSASGKASVIVSGHAFHVSSGDRLRLSAMLSATSPPLNPGEYDFAARDRQHRKLCQLRAASPDAVEIIQRGQWWLPSRQLERLRTYCADTLWKHINPRRAAVASALLLGAREQLGPAQKDRFLLTGTAHLLAVSGLHVGILASGFWLVARVGLMSRRMHLIVAVALVILYALLADARPPVIRAAILVTILSVGCLLGRPALAFNSLAFAAVVLLILNPTNVFQTGTQLSFLAVATLILCRPLLSFEPSSDPLDRLIFNSRPWVHRAAWSLWLAVVRVTLAGAAIWMAAFPLIAFRFHLAAPLALLMNPILILPITLALFSGFGELLFGWLLPPLGAFLGRICDLSLHAMEVILTTAQGWKLGHFWTPGAPAWWVASFYLSLGVWAAVPRLHPPRRWSVTMLVVWLAVGMGASQRSGMWPGRSKLPLRCTFIAVGHGTSVLIELPDGRAVLYDAGSMAPTHYTVQSISAVLWHRRIRHLDAVIISHADADHYNAVPELLDRFTCGVVYVSPVMFDEESEALDELRRAIVQAEVPLRHLFAGLRLSVSPDVVMEVRHPPAQGVSGRDNANSIVLQIEHEGRRIFLPGDLEEAGLEDILSQPKLDCDVLMAPHHGSAKSDPFGFASWSTPEYVIVSNGIGRDHQYTTKAYEACGAQVLHTARAGAVAVTIEEGKLGVAAFRDR